MSNSKKVTDNAATTRESEAILDKYEDTKKMLKKTGVKFISRNKIQFDQSVTGEDYINSGSFGSVYRCRRKRGSQKEKKTMAVKIIHGKNISNWSQIRNELLLQNLVEHTPYVVEIFNFCLSIDLTLWLVMEYCPIDLVEYTEQEVDLVKNELCYSFRLDEIFMKLIAGLEYIHDNRIIHRDIKPGNILMVIESEKSLDGSESSIILETPKICDFGISTRQGNDLDEEEKTLAKLTLADRQGISEKTAIGTSLFMAGEIYSGNYDESVDVFALALSYFQCKTYTSEKGKNHWQRPMKTPITNEMIKNNNLTFSNKKNYKVWPNIIIQATSLRPLERPSCMQARERLNNKYLASIAEIGRKMGLNRKKPNFKIRLTVIVGLPLALITLVILLFTLKCPEGKITSIPWKPVWFGGCKFCEEIKPDYHGPQCKFKKCSAMATNPCIADISAPLHWLDYIRKPIGGTCEDDASNSDRNSSNIENNGYVCNCNEGYGGQNCEHITILEMDFQGITLFDSTFEATFKSLTELKVLSLNENLLSMMPDKHEEIIASYFVTPVNLEELYLNHNKLSYVTKDLFSNLSKLKRLGLGGNGITSIDAEAFQNNGELTELFLHNNRIDWLPFGIFSFLPNLEILRLYNNHLGSIRADLLRGNTELTELYLYSNRITILEESAFSSLTKLKKLWLQENRINEITNQHFKNNTELAELDLNYNKIKIIDSNAFKFNHKLNILQLSGNQIENLDANLFSNLTAVTSIDLSNNRNITDLPADLFKNNINLKQLNLKGNRIKSFQPNLFKSLVKLDSLLLDNQLVDNKLPIPGDLFQNNIELSNLNLGDLSIQNLDDPRTFSSLTKLQNLYLERNEIGPNLPKTAFQFNSELKQLRLHKNKIQNLDGNAFSSLTKVESIYLNRNDITAIPFDLFKNNFELTLLHLDENEIENLPASSFSNLFKLSELTLSFNKLEILPAGLFDTNIHLTKLYLADNQIKNLDAGLFSTLEKLSILELNENQIESLPVGLFDNNIELTYLELSVNQIKSVDRRLFENNVKLKELYLSVNKIKSFPEDMIENHPSIWYGVNREGSKEDDIKYHIYCGQDGERVDGCYPE